MCAKRFDQFLCNHKVFIGTTPCQYYLEESAISVPPKSKVHLFQLRERCYQVSTREVTNINNMLCIKCEERERRRAERLGSRS